MSGLCSTARVALALALTLPASCASASEHRAAADREVYALIDARRAKIVGGEAPFTIEPPADSLRRQLLRGEPAPRALTIADCIAIGAESSRAFQERREALYLVALDLTLERWRLSWQPSATGEAAVVGSGNDADSQSVAAGVGLDRILGTGAEIVSDIGLSLQKDLASGDGFDLTSTLFLDITQPLLRGAGQRIVEEPLTQAERDLVYEVRAFERFRRTFAFDVAERVYGVLQQLDVVENEEQNFANLVLLRQRNEAMAEAGRLSDIQVDQAQQDELRSKNRLLEERQRLQRLLDDLKLFLGLPVDAEITVDSRELEVLAEKGLFDIALAPERAVEIAHVLRLDYQTALDEVDDTERKVHVAADALRTGLDLRVIGDSESAAGQPLDHDQSDVNWDARLTLELPIDRLPERNEYRAALIDEQAARRDAEQLADEIAAELRDSLRETSTRNASYAIQLNAVELAERRIESARLNLDAGRADTRDLLEAQAALLEAQNAVTSALVDYTLAVLALYRDLELLRVDSSGIRVEDAPLQEPLEVEP